MEHDDLFDELRAANPYVSDGSTPPTTTSADARFTEITMQPHDTTTSSKTNPAAAPSRWRPLIAVPTALALVAIVVVSALVFSAVTAPSAYALVNEAAQTSASFDSGKVEITIDLREVPDDITGTLSLVYRYDGDDFSMTQDFSRFVGAQTDDLGEFTVIQVGDLIYTQLPGFDTEGSFFESPVDSQDVFDDVGFGVNPETINPANVVSLLERADDFSEIESTNDVTTYRASVAIEVIRELGAEQLPPGLSLLADGESTDLPETLGVTASVKDGQITTLVVDIIGNTPDGYTDATITTTFSELGQPQGIVAPPADQISDLSEMDDFGMPEGMEEVLEVLNELDERRPELCQEVFDDFEDATGTSFDEDTFAELNENFANCLIEAGETEAAEAFLSLTSDS